jgi:ParB-like chromosome segregation protein Spo0J
MSELFLCLIALLVLAGVLYAVGGKPVEPPRRRTNAKRRFVLLKLSEIKIDAKRFSHRSDLTDETIEDLFLSIVEEGAMVPPTVWQDPASGSWYAVAGTRRLLAHHKAVNDNVDRSIFHEHMELPCLEIFDCDEVDLQLTSVADNTIRRDLSVPEKIAVAGDWSQQKMPVARCAKAMRVSESQYRRWVLLAENPWMVQMIEDDCIDPSFAAKIVELAKSKSRLVELQQDIEDWVAETRLAIKRMIQRKADAHKKVPEAEQRVKFYLTKKIQQRWLECVKEQKRLDDEVGLRFGILFDPEKRTLTIPALEADARCNPADLIKVLEELAEGPTKVTNFIKQIRIDHELRSRLRGIAASQGLLRGPRGDPPGSTPQIDSFTVSLALIARNSLAYNLLSVIASH